METRILKVNPENPEEEKISQAAGVISDGGLVAFPTETVYGLGADGLNEEAVKKIFSAKSRPQDNPLIVHVSRLEQVEELVREIPEKAKKLMKEFWPGPLTLIMKKSDSVPDVVSCGMDSVAVRMPQNKIALGIIDKSDCPVSAPSANLSGRPSPTDAEHVIEDLAGRVDMIINGGSVNIGLESTVLDLTSEIPVILRPGRITKSQLENVIGKVEYKNKSSEPSEEKRENKPKSPGMKYKHYSPKAKVYVIKTKKEEDEIFEKYPDKKIMKLDYSNEEEMARNMFRDFRKTDNQGYDIIILKEVKDKDFGSAIMDRLRKASSER